MFELAMRARDRLAFRRRLRLIGFGSMALFAVQNPAAAATTLLAQSAPDAKPTPPAEAKPAESLGTPAVVIDGKAAESLLGKKVQTPKGDDLGRIVDVIVDKAGQIRAAIVDFGGFLGVGSRKIAVDWHAVHMSPDGKLDHLVIDMPPDQLRSAPAYKEGEPVVVVGTAADQNKAASPAPVPTPAPAPPAPAAPAATPPVTPAPAQPSQN